MSPSSMVTTVPSRPNSSMARASSWAGLWQSTMSSARSASSPFVATASPPVSAASAAARSGSAPVQRTGSPHPRARARAMFPLPTRPITAGSVEDAPGAPPRDRSRLVEEALLDQPRPLLRRDLDVARRQHEDLVGDPLHAAVERVGETRREVDEALGEVGLRALQVEDHRDAVLEAVGDLLGIVEALRNDEVHTDIVRPPVASSYRPQDARRPAGVLVGEDVVDVVAPAAARHTADVGPLPIAILELHLGLGLGIVVVALLRQAEVDERAVPGVAE